MRVEIPSTRGSVLDGLGQENSELAWERFNYLYRPILLLWAKQTAVDRDEAEDILAHIYAHLLPRLRRFTYCPELNFRGWLRQTVHSAVMDFRRQKARQLGLAVDSKMLEGIVSEADENLLEEEFERAFSAMMRQAQEIADRVRKRVQPENWQLFYQTYVLGKETGELAEELGIDRGKIYVARCRILGMLRAEAESRQ